MSSARQLLLLLAGVVRELERHITHHYALVSGVGRDDAGRAVGVALPVLAELLAVVIETDRPGSGRLPDVDTGRLTLIHRLQFVRVVTRKVDPLLRG